MPGDVLLAGAERVRELSDGGLAGAQPVEQPDAHRLADDAESLGDHLDQRIRERMGNRRPRLDDCHHCAIVPLYDCKCEEWTKMKNAQALVHGVTVYGSASGGVDR